MHFLFNFYLLLLCNIWFICFFKTFFYFFANFLHIISQYINVHFHYFLFYFINNSESGLADYGNASSDNVNDNVLVYNYFTSDIKNSTDGTSSGNIKIGNIFKITGKDTVSVFGWIYN